MRIICPSCAAAYEVPASRLTPRKMVRCSGCGGEWVPPRDPEEALPPAGAGQLSADGAPEPEAAMPGTMDTPLPGMTDTPLPAVTAMDRLAASATRPRRSASLIAAWILTIVVLASAVGATVAWRGAVVRVWPPSARILGPAGGLARR